ncbi:ABC transporter ATP-binding protein [Georgenia deserti]|uniref:ABC transporter ATP-binding protein n=1 Tax=Georgenia deserti TaxID=2093781 RepID=A0ABW4L598_9MICO
MLAVHEVTKRYGTIAANEDVSLVVRSGEVVGLLGHNGAGKTTLVNQVVGIARPDSGSITVDGLDAVARPEQARRHCAVQAQASVPIDGLTPALAVELVGRIRGGNKADVRGRAAARFERLDMTAWKDRPTDKLSGGVKRLVAYCLAVAVPTPVVVLDEPTNDVDPVRRRLLWQEIRREADSGAAVLLVTHNVHEAEHAVDRLVVLEGGRVLTQGTPSQLTAGLRDRLRLELRSSPGRRPAPPPGVEVNDARDGLLNATVSADDAEHVMSWARAAQRNGEIETFAIQPASLEDAYVQLTAAVAEEAAG